MKQIVDIFLKVVVLYTIFFSWVVIAKNDHKLDSQLTPLASYSQEISNSEIKKPITRKNMLSDIELMRRVRSHLEALQEDLDQEKDVKAHPGIIKIITDSLSVPLEIEADLKRKLKLFADSLIINRYIGFYTNPHKALRDIDNLDSFDACVQSIDTFASKSDITATNEHVVFALAVKYAIRAGFISYKERLKDLQEINKLRQYWVRQHQHQTRYLLHKSPHKWFLGKPQEDEIEDNIAYIENVQDIYYEHLGALVSQLYKFDPQASQEQQREWIAELLQRIDAVWGMRATKKRAITDTSKLVSAVQEKLSRVKENRKELSYLIKDVRKPNHFVRNWIWYTGAIATGSAAYCFYQKNPEVVRTYLENMKDSVIGSEEKKIEGAWDKFVVGPFNAILDNTIRRERIKVGKVSELKQRALMRNEVIMENLTKSMIATNGNSSEGLYFNLPDMLDPSYCEKIDEIFEEMGQKIKRSNQAMVDQGFATSPGEKVNKIIYNVKDIVQPLLFFATETITSFQATSNEALDLLYSTVDDQQLNLNLGLLTPALLAGWAGIKSVRELYNKLTNRNFYQLSKNLKEIAILLQENGRTFTHRKYGKLLFLTHELKHEIIRLVPKKNNMRQDMLADVIRIESRKSSIEEKITTITGMKDHYFAFLYKGVAA